MNNPTTVDLQYRQQVKEILAKFYPESRPSFEKRLNAQMGLGKKASTLLKLILKYGVEEAEKIFEDRQNSRKVIGTLEWYIAKYGEMEGPIKYKEKNSKLSVGVETLRKSGKSEEEIAKIRSTHSTKSKNTPEVFQQRYGESAEALYDEYVQRLKENCGFSVGYWTNRGYSPEEAKKLQSQVQTKNITTFLETGKLSGAPVSKLETRFFEKLAEITELDLERGTQCKIECGGVNFYCDYQHPSNKKIIEIFGDYWHMNPDKFGPSELNQKKKQTAAEIWRIDEIRIAEFEKYGYETLVIWESDIKTSISEQLSIAKQFLES